MTTEQIQKQIDELLADTLVATNDGTHGSDPQFNTWKTYERIDGTRHTTGSDPDNSPGYARHFSLMSATARRSKIEALKISLKTSRTVTQQQEAQCEALARGWDGYQFVGAEEGQRRLAAMNQ